MASPWFPRRASAARSIGAIGHEDAVRAAGHECAGGKLAGLASAQDHHAASGKAPEDFLREIDGHRTDGYRAAGDVGLGAHFLGHVEGALEELVEMPGGRAGPGGDAVGFFHLAEDFGFAEHHRFQPGDNAKKMPDGAGALAAVEVFAVGRLQAGAGGEEGLDGGKPGAGSGAAA